MYAYVHLTRLCGCNFKQPVTVKGNFIFVHDPQDKSTRYRINRKDFESGKRAFRNSWVVELWTESSARRTESELNWQT